MRLACPSCAATYDLPETLFLTGARKVRCVKCGHAWMAENPAAAAAEADAPPPEADGAPAAATEAAEAPGAEAGMPEGGGRRSPLRRRAAAPIPPVPAPPDLSLSPPPSGAGRSVIAAWVASLVLVAALCWGGWTWREDVMDAWPASTHLYAALGGR